MRVDALMRGYTPSNPYAGYAPPTMVDPGDCALAKQALTYAIVGLFCFGSFLGPMAIAKARGARVILRENPGMRGEGMATAALVLGVCEIALWMTGIFARAFL